MDNNRNVVITGAGCISSLGKSKQELYDNSADSEKTGISELKHIDVSKASSRIGGEIKDFDLNDHLDSMTTRRVDRSTAFSIVAARDLVNDSKLDLDSIDKFKLGCFLGTQMGGVIFAEDNYTHFAENPRAITPYVAIACFFGSNIGQITMDRNFWGKSLTFCDELCASTNAIGYGYQRILDNTLDYAMVGGCEAVFTPIVYHSFDKMKLLSPNNDKGEAAYRPFSNDSEGMLLGEGAAMVMLEDYETAKKRNANVYASVLGFHSNFDGMPFPEFDATGDSLSNALKDVLNKAQINLENIDLIIGEGKALKKYDDAEQNALKAVFGDRIEKDLPVFSMKRKIGHTCGASGAFDMMFAIDILENNAATNYSDYLMNPVELKEEYTTVLLYSMGFFGRNSALIIQKPKNQ
ncbi:MAG: hypothetical protein MI922_27125 [Bacteroidales bacterium]|nr:hypothetical protein [Bacteroidales bacterium]